VFWIERYGILKARSTEKCPQCFEPSYVLEAAADQSFAQYFGDKHDSFHATLGYIA
jgi:hypothetical protein